MQASDLPAGWTGTPDDDDPAEDAKEDATMDRCLGIRNTDPDVSADADSDDFTEGEVTISSEATSYRSAADVTSDVAGLNSPKANSCVGTELRADVAGSLPAGAVIRGIDVTSARGSGRLSNVVDTISATISVSDSGKVVPIYAAIVFITGPRIEANLSFVSEGQPVPAALQTALITKVAARAASEGATAA